MPNTDQQQFFYEINFIIATHTKTTIYHVITTFPSILTFPLIFFLFFLLLLLLLLLLLTFLLCLIYLFFPLLAYYITLHTIC